MEYKINFENEPNKNLSKVFTKQVYQHSHLLDNYSDYESYIVDCIKNTFHVLKMQNILGKATRVNDNYSFCIFCSDYMKPRELKRTLSCGHEFHKKCLDKWIYKFYADSCPCCKKEIK